MTSLVFPSQVKLTTNAVLRVGRLPLGVRTPATYTVTAVTPSGSTRNITVTAAATLGATSLTVADIGAGALPANSILQAGALTIVTSASAAANATSLTVYPLNFDIAANTVFTYSPGALTQGSTLLSVSSLPVLIDTGTKLTFGGQTLTVTGRSPAGATQLRVSAIQTAITANTTATTRGLFTVAGLTSNPAPSPTPKLVETTNFLSGIGKEQVVAGIDATITANFNIIVGDLGGELILELLRDKTQYNREIFFEVEYEDGEKHEGAAIVTAGSEQGEVQDKRMIQATLQVQGNSYVYTKSTRQFF